MRGRRRRKRNGVIREGSEEGRFLSIGLERFLVELMGWFGSVYRYLDEVLRVGSC